MRAVAQEWLLVPDFGLIIAIKSFIHHKIAANLQKNIDAPSIIDKKIVSLNDK
jgi:hypothetical protein